MVYTSVWSEIQSQKTFTIEYPCNGDIEKLPVDKLRTILDENGEQPVDIDVGFVH